MSDVSKWSSHRVGFAPARWLLLSFVLLAAACNQSVKPSTGGDDIPPQIVINGSEEVGAAGVSASAVGIGIDIKGTATDNVGVTRVTYKINGSAEQNVSITAGPSVSFVVPMNNLSNGTYNIEVYAYDAAGNKDGRTLTIGLGTADTVRPTVTLTSPTAGITVTAPGVNVQGTANDNTSVVRVSYQINGGAEQNVQISAGSNLNLNFSAGTLVNGANTIKVNAYDAAGNSGSASVSVTYNPPPSTTGQRTLLASYKTNSNAGTVQQPTYAHMVYRPRGFAPGNDTDAFTSGLQDVVDPGVYRGWDMLVTSNESFQRGGATRADWLEFTLNRAATVAVVWRGDNNAVPTWLSLANGWQESGRVRTTREHRTFRKAFQAGTYVMPAPRVPNGGGQSYLVLFAESNGQPSGAPTVPAGLPVPQPNTTCPDWVHDQYQAKGPDGQMYRTWHPQIDPVYWCYFHHEHGSDPELFIPGIMSDLNTFKQGRPLYDYVNVKAKTTERHQGFKNYVLESNGYRLLFTHHFGTSTLAGACGRFHQLNMAAAQNGIVVADITFLADHGPSVDSQPDRGMKPLTPEGCSNQAGITNTTGSRAKKVWMGTDGVGRNDALGGYEAWRIDAPGNILGFISAGLTFKTSDPAYACRDFFCRESEKMRIGNNVGANHFITFLPNAGFGIQASRAARSGEFYTDPYGRSLRNAGDADAVRQYIQPGLNMVLSKGVSQDCFTLDAWQMYYASCVTGPPIVRFSLENSLDNLGVPDQNGVTHHN